MLVVVAFKTFHELIRFKRDVSRLVFFPSTFSTLYICLNIQCGGWRQIYLEINQAYILQPFLWRCWVAVLPTHEALQPADGFSSLAADQWHQHCQAPVCGVPINGSPNRPPHVPVTHPLRARARIWPMPSPTMLAVADRHAHAGRDDFAVQARALDGAPERLKPSCNATERLGLPTARDCLWHATN
jgi:hypothetical protein